MIVIREILSSYWLKSRPHDHTIFIMTKSKYDEGREACTYQHFFITVHFGEKLYIRGGPKFSQKFCLWRKNCMYGLTICKKTVAFPNDHSILIRIMSSWASVFCVSGSLKRDEWKRSGCHWCRQKVNSRKPQRGEHSEKKIKIKHHKLSRRNGAKKMPFCCQ